MPAYNKADLERRMHGAVDSLKSDLGGLRTGRANTALLDPVTVEVYGSNMPLNQVATVSAPEPRLLSVQVWEPAGQREMGLLPSATQASCFCNPVATPSPGCSRGLLQGD